MARSALFSKSNPGRVFTIYNYEDHPNNIYFVNSVTGTNGARYGNSPDSPVATINYAITKCTASKGDVIYVMPGHTESISGAAAIACNIAGVSIIGLGTKANRPLITLHTTSTTIAISAANVMLRNLQIATDVDAVASVFNITAAGAVLDRVDFIETAACACLQLVLTTAAATDLQILNCRWVQTATAGTALMQWIKLVGADRVKITGNFANLKGYATANPANGVVVGVTTASKDVEIMNNRFVITNSTGNVPISLLAASTGIVADNRVASSKTAIAGSVACASAYAMNNYVAHTANASGILDPAVDS